MSVQLNQQYGRLFTISRLPNSQPAPGAGQDYRHYWWLCRCSCGTPFVRIRADLLSSGQTRSCGCLRSSRNGQSNSRTYKTWAAMRRRCNDPKHPFYSDYGGRGIRVCAEWDNIETGFEVFVRDMGLRPDGRTLDRLDVDAGYGRENCRWATLQEQRWNRRDYKQQQQQRQDRDMENEHWDRMERLEAEAAAATAEEPVVN